MLTVVWHDGSWLLGELCPVPTTLLGLPGTRRGFGRDFFERLGGCIGGLPPLPIEEQLGLEVLVDKGIDFFSPLYLYSTDVAPGLPFFLLVIGRLETGLEEPAVTALDSRN